MRKPGYLPRNAESRGCKAAVQGLTFVIAIALIASFAYGAVSTSPSSVNVARGRAAGVTISYSFSGIAAGTHTFDSSQGDFLLAGQSSGTINAPISLTVSNGTGNASESIIIPLGVVERAFSQGSATFIYQRVFLSQTAATQTAEISFRITPESIADFSLKNIELYFDAKNRKSEAIVNRNDKGLKACTDIYFNGSGFLQGYWDVDGRIIENISRHVSFGTKITLTTPDIPGLPTFDPGYHIVKFVVTSPQPQFELPQILYWVTDKEEPVKKTLNLLAPKDSAGISHEDEFRWDKMDGTAVYLVTFAKKSDKAIVFSAMTRSNSYRIPKSVIPQFFSRDAVYLWQIKGFDENGRTVFESEAREIKLK